MATQQDHPFKFLDLPREIRDSVYDYVLADETSTVSARDGSNAVIPLHRSERGAILVKSPNIIRASQQLRSEARPRLCPGTFCIDMPTLHRLRYWQCRPLFRFPFRNPQSIPRALRNSIMVRMRDIQLHAGYLDVSPEGLRATINELTELWAFLPTVCLDGRRVRLTVLFETFIFTKVQVSLTRGTMQLVQAILEAIIDEQKGLFRQAVGQYPDEVWDEYGFERRLLGLRQIAGEFVTT